MPLVHDLLERTDDVIASRRGETAVLPVGRSVLLVRGEHRFECLINEIETGLRCVALLTAYYYLIVNLEISVAG